MMISEMSSANQLISVSDVVVVFLFAVEFCQKMADVFVEVAHSI